MHGNASYIRHNSGTQQQQAPSCNSVQEKLDVNSVTCSVSRQIGLTLDDDIKIHNNFTFNMQLKAKQSAFKSKQIGAKRHPIVERFAKNFAT